MGEVVGSQRSGCHEQDSGHGGRDGAAEIGLRQHHEHCDEPGERGQLERGGERGGQSSGEERPRGTAFAGADREQQPETRRRRRRRGEVVGERDGERGEQRTAGDEGGRPEPSPVG